MLSHIGAVGLRQRQKSLRRIVLRPCGRVQRQRSDGKAYRGSQATHGVQPCDHFHQPNPMFASGMCRCVRFKISWPIRSCEHRRYAVRSGRQLLLWQTFIQWLQIGRDEKAVLPNQLIIKPDLPATVVRSLDQNQVPVNAAAIAVVGFVVRIAGCKVE
jgi:hypothetical protein